MSSNQTNNQSRLSWPRDHAADGTPIVGWECKNCGHEVEARYKPSRLAACPNCGGNANGVRGWTVEEIVDDRCERLRDQLAAHYGLPDTDKPVCASCGTTEDVSVCPGPNLDDFQHRCNDCRRFPQWFWQPGDHPSLLLRRWIETCDRCGAEFTSIFGVTFWIDHARGHETEDICLRCVSTDRVRHYLEGNS